MDEATYLRSLIHGWAAPHGAQPFSMPSLGGRSIADIIVEIGMVEGLPADLSTNPKYREGFGVTRNVRDIAE